MKVLTIFGTRPEAIKMAPLIKELESRPAIESLVCVTAQHRQMLDQVLSAFAITPDFDLNIMQPGQTLSDITSRSLLGLEKIIQKLNPDLVMVHGDTTTALSGAMAAFYNKIKIGHVEAGLRTGNKYSPWPEEANRSLISVLADYHFAPTELSRQNLLSENKLPNTIYVTGNTVIDALKTTVRNDYHNSDLEWAKDSRLILLTAHRRENLGQPMENIFKAIRQVVDEFDDVKVLYPVHLNPIVREMAHSFFDNHKRIRLIEPLEVWDFHNFINRSYMVMTDSGGIQEEAPSLGKPVLVLRDTTERPEGVEAGTLWLTGTETESVATAMRELLTNQKKYLTMSQAINPYGDGRASQRIVDVISKEFNIN